MVGAEEKFIKWSQMAGKRYFEIGFCKYSKKAFLLIFKAAFTKSVLETLSYPQSTTRPTTFGPREHFSR